MYYYTDKRKRIILQENPLASGGEGSIYLVKGGDLCAKIYREENLSEDIKIERYKKLKTMVAHPPRDLTHEHNKRIRTFAWPQALLYSNRYNHQTENFIGFLMPYIDTKQYVRFGKYLSDPAFNGRRSLYDLIAIICNLCTAVDQIHCNNHYIGDFREDNFLISPSEHFVVFLDCDSFQITNPDNNEIYYCRFRDRSEYVAPELLTPEPAKYLDVHYSDLFILGIIIFKMLLGFHPFQCGGDGVGNNNSIIEKIGAGLFPYGKNARDKKIHPPKWVKINYYDFLPESVKNLFYKCFVDGHDEPKKRPTANEWFNVFKEWGEILEKAKRT